MAIAKNQFNQILTYCAEARPHKIMEMLSLCEREFSDEDFRRIRKSIEAIASDRFGDRWKQLPHQRAA